MGEARDHAMHNASSSATWLDCSLHYHYKKDALEGDLAIEWDTAGEAARRGTIQHDVSEHALKFIMGGLEIEEGVDRAIRKVKRKLTDEERANVIIAMEAVLDLLVDGMEVERELAVPLSHEPGSTGKIDVAGRCDKHYLVADYKFGQTAVSANSTQNRIYAANLIEDARREGWCPEPDFPVMLAIVQPKLHREALVRMTTVAELDAFRFYVEGVVKAQVNGHDRRGAGSLKTCEWCPMAKAGCFHRVNLVGTMLADLSTPVKMAPHVIEEIVRSRTAMKKVIDECVGEVVEHPKRYPNWTRVPVNNARAWSELLDLSEIESKLIDKGAANLHTLKTPAKVKDENPTLVDLVDTLSAGQGHHVRLLLGKPKAGDPKKEPTKRASAKSAKPAKKSARKKAAKKPARKKAAKKKARKKNGRRI